MEHERSIDEQNGIWSRDGKVRLDVAFIRCERAIQAEGDHRAAAR